MKVIVDRQRWLRGLGNNFPEDYTGVQKAGLRVDGKMCCLGFLCTTLGIPEDELENKGMPADLGIEILPFVTQDTDEEGFPIERYENVYPLEDLAEINDDYQLRDQDRENKLKELAKEINVEFEFIN